MVHESIKENLMKKTLMFVYSILFMALLVNCQSSSEKKSFNEKEYFDKTMTLTTEFQKNMLTELTTALKAGDTEKAISQCKDKSPIIQKEIQDKHGFEVKRVSDKPRNPNSKPDAWEMSVIEGWKKNAQEKKPLEPVTLKTDSEYRVMRPIIIATETCLKCHGDDKTMDKKAAKSIKEMYKTDMAKGYTTVGQVRGAISSKWKLK